VARRLWTRFETTLIEPIAPYGFALCGGAYTTLAQVIPQRLSREPLGQALPPSGVLRHQMLAGVELESHEAEGCRRHAWPLRGCVQG
jgi:hypothetical protein